MPKGARLAIDSTPVTRSRSNAPQASACGPPPEPAHHQAARLGKVIKDALDVPGGRGDGPAWLPRRAAPAGTGERDQAQAMLVRGPLQDADLDTRPWSAVVQHQGSAVLRPGHQHIQLAPVR
ncbi:hypothetical protein [Kibdelosporangium philippinense]|uniref:hypothetical protein n=1 Tax=Kibdelosporangium philippinense TaxID=211113 RepID=UPI0035E8F070